MTNEHSQGKHGFHDEAFEQDVRAAVKRQVLLFREFSLTATLSRPIDIADEGLALYGKVSLAELNIAHAGLGKVPVRFFVDREEAERHGFIVPLTGERRARWEAKMDQAASQLEEELDHMGSAPSNPSASDLVQVEYLHHEYKGTLLVLYGIAVGGGLHGCRVRFPVERKGVEAGAVPDLGEKPEASFPLWGQREGPRTLSFSPSTCQCALHPGSQCSGSFLCCPGARLPYPR